MTTPYANVEIVGRLAGIPIMDGKHRKKMQREDGTWYYATMPEAVKTLTGKDGRTFFSFTVVVESGNTSEWIQCICYDESILAEDMVRGQMVCVQGRLSVRDKKDEQTNTYRTNVRVLVRKVVLLIDTVAIERAGTDTFKGAMSWT